MRNPSKMVVDRQELAEAVITAAENIDVVVTPLTAKLTPLLAEGETLDVATMQRVLGRLVQIEKDRLVTFDKSDIGERADELAPKLRRDRAVKTLRRELIQARRGMAFFFGDEGEGLIAVGGATAYRPAALLRQAESVIERLTDPDRVLPPVIASGATFDAETLLAGLRAAYDELADTLASLAISKRQTDITVTRKQSALSRFDKEVGAVAKVLEGLFALADEDALATRVRPTRRRTTPVEAPTEEPLQEPVTPVTEPVN